MARDLNDYYNLYQYIVRKERGVFVTPPQFTANLDAAQLDVMEFYFKQYGIDQTVHDALRPFRIFYPFTTDSQGLLAFPTTYQHMIGTVYTVNGSTISEVTFVNEDEFVSALKSQLRPVSITNPIARDTSTGFSLYPQVAQSGYFTYIKRPNTPVYAYTQIGRVIAYNAAGSTQLQWNEVYINNIMARALKYAGVNMDEQGIYQYAEQYTKETS